MVRRDCLHVSLRARCHGPTEQHGGAGRALRRPTLSERYRQRVREEPQLRRSRHLRDRHSADVRPCDNRKWSPVDGRVSRARGVDVIRVSSQRRERRRRQRQSPEPHRRLVQSADRTTSHDHGDRRHVGRVDRRRHHARVRRGADVARRQRRLLERDVDDANVLPPDVDGRRAHLLGHLLHGRVRRRQCRCRRVVRAHPVYGAQSPARAHGDDPRGARRVSGRRSREGVSGERRAQVAG